MRAGSRIFVALALFGLFAGTLFTIGLNDRRAAQGATLLLLFALTCGYLAYSLRKPGSVEIDAFPASREVHELDVPNIHLPPPSWYPAIYSVVLLALVLGVLYAYPLLWAALAGFVVATIGWARESVHEYRVEIAHAAHGHVDEADPAAIRAAHQVHVFVNAHHGGDAMVSHLGRGRAEIVLVGADGAWGTIAVPSYDAAVAGVRMSAVELHETWPSHVANRISGDPELWLRMAGAPAAVAPAGPHGPRDGATQSGAKIFLALGIFGLFAAGLFTAGLHSEKAMQGAALLSCFAVACGYLYVALRGARGGEGDFGYADERGIAAEPTEPGPPIDRATLHLPGPSWWPAAFSVALLALVLGIAYDYRVLWGAIVLFVVCCVGWGIESVHEYRATLHHHDTGPASH